MTKTVKLDKELALETRSTCIKIYKHSAAKQILVSYLTSEGLHTLSLTQD
jgi:hypothetical protein